MRGHASLGRRYFSAFATLGMQVDADLAVAEILLLGMLERSGLDAGNWVAEAL